MSYIEKSVSELTSEEINDIRVFAEKRGKTFLLTDKCKIVIHEDGLYQIQGYWSILDSVPGKPVMTLIDINSDA